MKIPRTEKTFYRESELKEAYEEHLQALKEEVELKEKLYDLTLQHKEDRENSALKKEINKLRRRLRKIQPIVFPGFFGKYARAINWKEKQDNKPKSKQKQREFQVQ